MALTYIGATSFAQSGPEQWRLGQFELDQMSVPFSGAATGLTTYISSLTRGSAWSGDANMYLTGWTVSDANKQYPTVTQEYLGAKGGVLPPQKQTSGGQVSSATTNTDADIFPSTVTNPLSVQFYAISNTLTFYSTNPNDTSEPDDPPEVDALITWDLGFGVQPGTSFPELVTYFLTKAFVQGIIEEPATVEPVVNGQYYQITKRKTRTLFPYAPPS